MMAGRDETTWKTLPTYLSRYRQDDGYCTTRHPDKTPAYFSVTERGPRMRRACDTAMIRSLGGHEVTGFEGRDNLPSLSLTQDGRAKRSSASGRLSGRRRLQVCCGISQPGTPLAYTTSAHSRRGTVGREGQASSRPPQTWGAWVAVC